MKIEFLTSYYHPYTGGIENVVEHLARGLSQKGHTVVVHTGDISPAGHKNLKSRQKMGSYLIKRYKMYPYSLFFPRMEHRDSVISMHNYSALMNDYAAIAYRNRKKILTPYGTITYTNAQRQHKYLSVLYDSTIGIRTLKNVETIVAMTNHEKKLIIKRLPENKNKVVVVPAGIDFIKGYSKKKVFPFNYFLSVGRISHTIRFEDIVSIMPYFTEFHYVLCGKDIGQIEKISRLAKELGVSSRLHYLGEISAEDKANLMTNCSVFIMSSSAEAFSIACLEAFYYANKVVAAKSGGVEDLFAEMGGQMYRTGDLVSLRNAISHALRFGSPGSQNTKRRMNIEKNYNWDKIVERYEELL